MFGHHGRGAFRAPSQHVLDDGVDVNRVGNAKADALVTERGTLAGLQLQVHIVSGPFDDRDPDVWIFFQLW